MMQILFSIIPILFFLILLFIKKFKIKEPINVIFWSCISVLVAILASTMLVKDTKNLNGTTRFFTIFITVALVEELAKYIAIKAIRPTSKNDFYITSMFIAIIFAAIENFSYNADTSNIVKLGIYRLLTPMHILFQIVMACFLNKSFTQRQEQKKSNVNIFEFLAVFVPTLLHTIWDYYYADISINNVSFNFVAITGILSYGIILFTIFRLKPDNYENKQENTEKNKSKWNVLKLIAIILFLISWITTFSTISNTTALGKTKKIDGENIEITVNNAEEINVNNSNFLSSKGTYTKVNVTIKNNNSTTKTLGLFNTWSLEDGKGTSINKEYINSAFTNELDSSIPGNSQISGNIYFKTNLYNDLKLQYKSTSYKDRESSTDTYMFKLK